MSNSASGLDNTSIHEIKIATRWCPELLTALVSLLQCIENAEKWPRNLTKGVVAFIPKDTENEQPKPEEFRPINILSTIYRIWAAARHAELADQWFPIWKHDTSYGGKQSKSADQLAFDTCVQIREGSQRKQVRCWTFL